MLAFALAFASETSDEPANPVGIILVQRLNYRSTTGPAMFDHGDVDVQVFLLVLSFMLMVSSFGAHDLDLDCLRVSLWKVYRSHGW